jgi:hypothetical protein
MFFFRNDGLDPLTGLYSTVIWLDDGYIYDHEGD